MRLLRGALGFVLDFVLVVLIPDALWARLCVLRGGHRYEVAILSTEDQGSYVIDPSARCTLCRLPMAQNVYEQLTDAYAAALETDEAW